MLSKRIADGSDIDLDLDLDFGGADREYGVAFQGYGIDVDRLPPAETGALVATAPIVAEMVNALDQWAFVRQVLRSPEVRHLYAVANAADPDPWKCRQRDAFDLDLSDRKAARGEFEELAASAPDEVLHRESISRLAFAPAFLGDKEKSSALLRRAQRAHRDDFGINSDLGGSLICADQPDEAPASTPPRWRSAPKASMRSAAYAKHSAPQAVRNSRALSVIRSSCVPNLRAHGERSSRRAAGARCTDSLSPSSRADDKR